MPTATKKVRSNHERRNERMNRNALTKARGYTKHANWNNLIGLLLWGSAYLTPCLAQSQMPVVLNVDVANVVQYVDDSTDFAKLATAPTATTGGAPLNFRKFIIIGD